MIKKFLDIFVPSRRVKKFSYIKSKDAWSTVLLFDWAAISVVELIIRFVRGKIFPDHLTALSLLFFLSGLIILWISPCQYFSMILFYISIVCDCADGKLARAIGIKSPHGVYVDALADMVIQGAGFLIISAWLVVRHDNWIGAISVAIFSFYIVVAHVNNISVALGYKSRAGGLNVYFPAISEVEVCFVGIPFIVVGWPKVDFVAPVICGLYFVFKFINFIK